jgi:hypothetical protein
VLVKTYATEVKRGWRWFFAAAAAYNFVIGSAGLVSGAAVNDRIVGLLVLCFGIVYAVVARDPARFGPALWAGVVGKAGVVAMLLPEIFAGRAAPGMGVILAGDGLFTLGFLVFLLRHRLSW